VTLRILGRKGRQHALFSHISGSILRSWCFQFTK
jgi:hypothetical protein